MAVVLIVEDEAPILFLAECFLQEVGYQTLTASTLAEAQAVINSDKRIDAVFTDVNLGNDHEGGLHVGQIAARTRPKIPMIYTSGRGLTDGMKALFVEPSSFLPKPYTNNQLVDALTRHLRVG